MRMDPAVAATRLAVRTALADVDAGDLVLVAVSGGADSLALAAATAVEAPRCGLRAGAVTVDHALQPGSADRARAVAAGCSRARARAGRGRHGDASRRRADPKRRRVRPGTPPSTRQPSGFGASRILLGHTLDDQAETVLLGLARGSGARSLAGMPAAPRLLRPAVPRASDGRPPSPPAGRST